ncbi:DUF1801 domain-containing protein [Lapidilactobacillus bayanensis]|uniref:DUF1801 domain-containing protein n=1 Tax=Lapidilactobacillus bayanensis TaxID=2485998 RepID=UPI000F77F949|nr:DUF1801 domain-containing protein [Lapidilactobacillus bayanensis]
MIKNIADYEAAIPEKWRESYFLMKNTIATNLPDGFELVLQYGMPTFVVPLSVYPQGYLKRQSEPLPFVSLAAQKNHLAVYHMGIIADHELLNWFETSYAKSVPTKLNMGKSCIRFTNSKNIPNQLISELMQRMSVTRWIELYEGYAKKT